jgi:nitrogen fixation protein FixH
MMVTRLTGRRFLFGLIGFFAIVFAVNGLFVYLALDTWSGLDVDNSFVQGISFEEEIQEAHEWKVEIDPKDLGNNTVRIDVEIARVDGGTASPYSMDAEVRRPASANDDQDVTLTEIAPRRYVAEVSLAGRGQWQIRVRGRNEDKAVLFRADKRLYLKP